MSLKNILSGWKNFIDKSDVTEALAVQRGLKCLDCKYKKKSTLMFFKDELKEIEGYICNKCSCPLSAKIRSNNEKCPLNKW